MAITFTPNPRIQQSRDRGTNLLARALQGSPNPLPNNPYYTPGMASMFGQLGSGLLARQANVQAQNIETTQKEARRILADRLAGRTYMPPQVEAPRKTGIGAVVNKIFPRAMDPAQAYHQGLGAGFEARPLDEIAQAAGATLPISTHPKGRIIQIFNPNNPIEVRSIHTDDTELEGLLEGGWKLYEDLSENVKPPKMREKYDDSLLATKVAIRTGNKILKDVNSGKFVGGFVGSLASVGDEISQQAQNMFKAWNKNVPTTDLELLEDADIFDTDNAQYDAAFKKMEEGGFFNLLSDINVTQQKAKANFLHLAYMLAKIADPGGRLSDRDVENFLNQLGGGTANIEAINKLITGKLEDALDSHNDLGMLYSDPQYKGGQAYVDKYNATLPTIWSPDQNIEDDAVRAMRARGGILFDEHPPLQDEMGELEQYKERLLKQGLTDQQVNEIVVYLKHLLTGGFF